MTECPVFYHNIHAGHVLQTRRRCHQTRVVHHRQVEADRKHQLGMLPVAQLHDQWWACRQNANWSAVAIWGRSLQRSTIAARCGEAAVQPEEAVQKAAVERMICAD